MPNPVDFRTQRCLSLKLLSPLRREPFYNLNYKKILAGDKNLLNIFIRDLFKLGTVNKTGLNVDILKRLVKNIERFEERF